MTDTAEARLAAMGLTLPAPVQVQVQVQVPEGLHLPFTFINVRGWRVLISVPTGRSAPI